MQIAERAKQPWKANPMYTLDASVWLREATPIDPAYHTCHALLAALLARAAPLYEPWLLLAEIGGSVSRLLRDPIRSRLYTEIVRTFPNTTFVALDEPLARETSDLAADYFLRGADALYAAVARRHGCVLISLDAEHHQRLGAILTILTPTGALAALNDTP